MRGEFSKRLYSHSLAVYPRELREEFAGEMALVFEEQMADAVGALEVLQIWMGVVSDMILVALPARFAPMAVPAVAIVTALVWFIGVLGLIPLARMR